MSKTKTVLMCPPTYFDIEYEINPWMHQDNRVDSVLAGKQWQKLFDAYSRKLSWYVQLIEPVNHLPDMVFATDNCLVLDGRAMLSNFRYPERQPETSEYEKWLHEHGYTDIRKSSRKFEGGDIVIFGDKIIAGFGFRSDLESHQELADFFNREVISLQIIDPYFYHLDTALVALNEDTAVVYPQAIDEPSQKRLKQLVPNLIEATQGEAKSFGLNAISDGQTIIYSDHSESLAKKYRAAGLETIGIEMSEFQKSGGGVKCLTLELG